MARGGPKPKQFSQVGANPGDSIIASNIATDPDGMQGPAYRPAPTEVYLGSGTFGNASDIDNVFADSGYPDFNNEFDALDTLQSLNGTQSVDVAYPGRLGENQTTIESIKVNIIGDTAAGTTPPQFRLRLYVDGAGTANPVFDSGLLEAPASLTEYEIDSTVINEQPASLKRYHVVIEGHLNATNQSVQCSRPFVRQE